MAPSIPPALPEFEIGFQPPDISPWIAGNTGIPGFTSLRSANAGPHVVLLAITHGNEYSGAIVLDRLLRNPLAPAVGTLTLGFVNLEAFARFDPKRPTASRFVDEDLNRVWEDTVLNGPRRSRELDRAREIRPLIDSADVLLDLHSMLWPADPLILSGSTAAGLKLARSIGTPELIVADDGHANGRRIIDYARFMNTGAAANLLEAGQHWVPETIDTAFNSVVALLRHLGMAELTPTTTPRPQRFARVTTTVTAASKQFSFTQSYRGGDVIPRRNSLIAMDGDREIRTPHDDSLLIMPSLRPSKGHTAVRIAQLLSDA